MKYFQSMPYVEGQLFVMFKIFSSSSMHRTHALCLTPCEFLGLWRVWPTVLGLGEQGACSCWLKRAKGDNQVGTGRTHYQHDRSVARLRAEPSRVKRRICKLTLSRKAERKDWWDPQGLDNFSRFCTSLGMEMWPGDFVLGGDLMHVCFS